jgi:cell wall-associated NlpC family hydrolase
MYKKILLGALLACCYIIPAVANDNGNNDLTPQDLSMVVSEAQTWKGTPYRYGGKGKGGVDCSHFVYEVYNQVVEDYSYRRAEDYPKDPDFFPTKSPKPGDLVVFPAVRGQSAHVGILTNVPESKFIGSQSSTGVKEASYAAGTYWGKRPYQIVSLFKD